MKNLLLLFALSVFCFQIGYTQPGTLDTSFGKNGAVRADFGANIGFSSIGKQVLLLPNGSIYVVFESSGLTFITKKHPDGSTDSTYGKTGFSVSVSIENSHAALQKDGKIVVAGNVAGEYDRGDGHDVHGPSNQNFAVARFNADGSLDHTFNGNGKVVTDFTGYDDFINSVAIQSNGKIVAAGYTSIYSTNLAYDTANERYYYPKISDNLSLARYNINGSLDSSFDGDGRLMTQVNINNSYTNSVAVAKDSKIVVSATGSRGLILTRFKYDGSIDSAFSVTDNLTRADSSYFAARALAIQNDEKIVAGGYWENSKSNKDFVVTRFNINGSRDNTFNKNGIQSTDFRTYDDYINAIVIQADGKIAAAGYASNGIHNAFAVARYNTNGSTDSTFDTDGKKMNFIGSYSVYAVSLAIESNGKLVAAGYNQSATTTKIAIAAYNANGSLDSTFNKTGGLIVYFKQKNTVFTANVVQKDGKAIAAGYAWNGTNYDNIIVRYKADGSLDNSFASDGILVTVPNSNSYNSLLALQADGKIVYAAGSSFARYNTDGSIDKTFSEHGKQTVDFDISVLKVQTDGKIVIAGGNTIARYTANGSLDNSFNGNGILSASYPVKDLAIQSDGKIVAGEDYDEETIYLLYRYNVDGSADPSFSAPYPWVEGEDSYFDSYFDKVSIQKDGKIVVAAHGGTSDRYSVDYYTLVARYNPDGSLDNTFSEDGKDIPLGNSTNAFVALQEDGKIIVASDLYEDLEYGYGYYEPQFSGYGMVRYDKNGHPDSSFGTNGKLFSQQDEVIRLRNLVIANNKLYAAGFGEELTVGSNPRNLTNFGSLSRLLLTVNKAPTVKITSPANKTVLSAPATVTINAIASDSDGSVTSVKFYIGSAYLKTDFTSPYSYTISNLPAGTYVLTVKATDNLGAQTVSAPVTIKVSSNAIVSNRLYLKTEKTALNDALGLRLSPNPAKNIVNIQTSGLQQGKPATISIISLSGIVLKTMRISNAATQLDVSSLVSGVYTLKIISEEKIIYKQFMKLAD